MTVELATILKCDAADNVKGECSSGFIAFHYPGDVDPGQAARARAAAEGWRLLTMADESGQEYEGAICPKHATFVVGDPAP